MIKKTTTLIIVFILIQEKKTRQSMFSLHIKSPVSELSITVYVLLVYTGPRVFKVNCAFGKSTLPPCPLSITNGSGKRIKFHLENILSFPLSWTTGVPKWIARKTCNLRIVSQCVSSNPVSGHAYFQSIHKKITINSFAILQAEILNQQYPQRYTIKMWPNEYGSFHWVFFSFFINPT